MRFRHDLSKGQEKIELQMTPMIDIVFQLLVFFIMTFKIVTIEGDFAVKMPLAAPSEDVTSDVPLPPIRVKLLAHPNGEMAGIQMGERSLPSFPALREEIRALVGTDTGPGSLAESAEVELDVDYDLHYAHVIEAITHISGYIDRSGGEDVIVKLIENIKFVPPDEPAP